MGMFDSIVKSAKSAAVTVGKKAGDAIDYSKKKLAEADIQSKRNDTYENIGRLYYDTCKTGADHSEEISLLVETVDNYTAALEELRSEAEDEESGTVCSVCGAVNRKGANFCANCANPLAENDYK